MTVYIVTGASRGLGYAFMEILARDSSNTVFGLVRNVAKTEEKAKTDNINKNSNIHILEGDVTSYDSMRKARSAVEKIAPVVDVLIANAAALTPATAFTKLTSHEHEPELLVSELQTHLTTNVIGAIITINTFLPLILKSSIKKVIAIGSGLADDSATNKYDLYENAPYTISKAALNTAIAKYNAAHGKTTDRVLFLSISPGLVATGNDAAPPPDSSMPQKFKLMAPHFTGPITMEESVDLCMKVINRASVDDENFAGGFVSQFGNKQWL